MASTKNLVTFLENVQTPVPNTSCLATIVRSLRDKTIRLSKRLALNQRLWVETLGREFGYLQHYSSQIS
jgi:hypothetical protein